MIIDYYYYCYYYSLSFLQRKKERRTIIVDIAVPCDCNVVQKEIEKREKYQDLLGIYGKQGQRLCQW